MFRDGGSLFRDGGSLFRDGRSLFRDGGLEGGLYRGINGGRVLLRNVND